MKKEKRDIILFFISKLITGIAGFFIITLYSALLSPEQYGEYSLISGFVSALISVFIGWIGSSALRYYIDYEDNKKTFFTNVLYYVLSMIVMMSIIIVIVSFISKTIPISNYLVATIFFTIAFSFYDVFEKVFRAAQKTVIYSIALILQSILNVALFFVFAKFLNMKTISIFSSVSISRTVFVVIAILSLYVLKNISVQPFDKAMFKKFLKYGLPMIGVWGVGWILSYCDRYIIAIFYNTSDVGIYDISYKMAENSINVFVSTFTLAIFPMLITAWKKNGKEDVENKIKEVLRYFFILILPAVMGLICISDKLYHLGILNSKYQSGRNIIIFICIGMFFNGLNSIFNKLWQLNEKTKNILYVMIASVIINIALNLIFVPKFGITIAAITTLISYIFSVIITYCLVRKEIKIKFDFKSLVKSIFATIIMSAFVISFNNKVDSIKMLFLEIFLAVIVYGIITLITKNVTIKEFKKGNDNE